MKIKYKAFNPNLPCYPPDKATTGSAGFDLTVVYAEKLRESKMGYYDMLKLDTNLSIEIPKGYVGKIYECDSTYKNGISLSNKVGIIDSDYRGSITAIINSESFDAAKQVYDKIKKGYHLKLFQLIIEKLEDVQFEESSNISETKRSEVGYDSTGLTNTVINK